LESRLIFGEDVDENSVTALLWIAMYTMQYLRSRLEWTPYDVIIIIIIIISSSSSSSSS